ncbi:MmpS family transport accessory protein [Streptomyces sp. Q6]|uniref:MmpS family transport accessory protein n=1 Tax=Streptomyces citrinus TaxID=3118173 RepID=A0ACD5A853_9ACTN
MTSRTESPAEEQARQPVDPSADDTDRRGPRADRVGILAAAVALALCGGLVLYGVLGGDDEERRRHVPTASVTYEVKGEGRADISYQGASERGTAVSVSGARLPWRTTVRVPLGRAPVVSVVLGEDGTTATCALAIRGRHVQSATAAGSFGRASCSGSLPSPAPSDD